MTVIKNKIKELREDQIPGFESLKQEGRTVLAIAPGGGKTVITTYGLEWYLNLNPKHRVLVLPHSTNVLKKNFTDTLRDCGFVEEIDFSQDFDPNCNIHICLPGSEKHIKGHYDLLVVDEAHQNYFAARVQRIIKVIKPSREWLLTGTPAPFNGQVQMGEKYNMHYLPMNEIPAQNFAKVKVELVASNFNWKDNSNENFEPKVDYVSTDEQIERSLDNVVESLIKRLKTKVSAEQHNNPNLLTKSLNKLKIWVNLFIGLEKTMFMTRNIQEAQKINEILNNKGIESVVSDHESDGNSDLLDDFKDGKYNVIVVVNRGRLGYDDTNLYNVIDMTGTHNINTIYQIIARVARPIKDNPNAEKFYLKVTTQEPGMMNYTDMCVAAAVCLTDRKFLESFNGNTNTIKTLFKKRKDKEESKLKSESNKKERKPPNTFILPDMGEDFINFSRNVLHNLDNPTSIYKEIGLAEARYYLGLMKNKPYGYWDVFENVYNDALQYKTIGEWEKNSPTSCGSSRNNNWHKECTKHMVVKNKPSGHWNIFENVYNDALQYKTIGEWQKNSSNACNSSLKNGWREECTKHMVRIKKPNGHWNIFENVYNDALKYTSLIDWTKNSPNACVSSRINGWRNECTKHMKGKPRTRKKD